MVGIGALRNLVVALLSASHAINYNNNCIFGGMAGQMPMPPFHTLLPQES